MPGPLLSPVLQLPDVFGYIGDVIRQTRHPVYNAVGVQVGSYDTLDALCQGQWYVFKGQAQPPASQLYVHDFWGNRVPLSTQCVRSAQANAAGPSVVYPQPVQTSSAAQSVADASQAATGDPVPINPADLTAATYDQATLTKYGTYAIWGVVGILGLSLLVGGNQGRR